MAVYCFGSTENGELGLGGIEEDHILQPRKQRLPFDRRKYAVVQLTGGKNHTILLLRNVALDRNEIFTCGSNERLQLGRVGSWKKLERVDALSSHNIIQISAGHNHCLVLSEAGQIFAWGCNIFGQLGLGSGNPQEIGKPSLVKKLAAKTMVQLVCGGNHSMALAKTGEIYAWGSNAFGQLGVGSFGNCISTPTPINALQWTPIRQLAAGGSHSAVLSYTGALYLWGKNEFGQLGLNSDLRNRTLPTLQTSLRGQNIAYVALGEEHSAALTLQGGLYTWGHGTYGQLGHSTSRNINEILPRKVFELMGSVVVQVSLGRCHTIAATKNGRVYSWGLGGSGQLGIGSNHSKSVPHHVHGPWVDIDVKDLLPRDGERSLCAVHSNNDSQGIVSQDANSDVFSDCSDNIKSACTAESSRTSAIDSAMEIDELNEDDNSSSDNDGNNFIIEEPDDVEANARSSNPVPSFLCNDSTVFTSRDHIEIDEYESDHDSDFEEFPQKNQLVLKQIVASFGDQSFALTQQYSEKALPTDFRQVESTSEIAKLDNTFFENFKDVSKDSIPLDIIDYIEEVFCSIPCWNASYICDEEKKNNDLNPNKSQKFAKFKVNFGADLDDSSVECGSIDWRQAFHGFNLIEDAQNDRINELICSSVMKMLTHMPDVWFQEKKENSLLLHEEVLRVYQLLPLFHLFQMLDAYSETSQQLITSLGNSILMLSKDAFKFVNIWWGCMPKHYLKSLVHIFKKSIEYNLIKQHESNNETSQQESSRMKKFSEKLHHNLAVCLEVLKLLYTSNKMVETVSYKEFYIHGIVDMFDLKMDYILFRNWKSNYAKSGSSSNKNYFLCNYPFIFDEPAKNMILDIDSEIQQQVAAESSVYRQIMFSQPIDGQIFVNPFLTISVHRNTILQETINQLCYLSKHDESDFKKPLRVNFEGEEAVDAGQGMKKEFFLLLMKEILDEQYGMFVEHKETNTIWFHHSSFEEETMFNLVGVISGLAIYNKVIINLPFPLVLYKKILGEKLEISDLGYLDPYLLKNLKSILESEFGREEFDAIFGEMNFTITLQTFGSPVEFELCPNGKNIRLTYDNREKYVHLYWQYILETSIEKQFASFRSGFMKVLDSTTLTIFHAEELMQMVSGQEVVDWTELESATEYKPPFSKEHPTIRLFWKVFHTLTNEQKKKLLFFLSGSERIPILGVKALKLSIQPMKVSEDHLPVAHTCFNILDLPQTYTSPDAEAKLRSKLLKACEYSKGFALA